MNAKTNGLLTMQCRDMVAGEMLTNSGLLTTGGNKKELGQELLNERQKTDRVLFTRLYTK